MFLDDEEEEKKKKEEEKEKEDVKFNVNDKKCTIFVFFQLLEQSFNLKVQEENIEFFFKQLGELKWEKPEETKGEIRKLLRNIDRKCFLVFQ